MDMPVPAGEPFPDLFRALPRVSAITGWMSDPSDIAAWVCLRKPKDSVAQWRPQHLPITASPLHNVTEVNCGTIIRSSPNMLHAWANSDMNAKAYPAFDSGYSSPGGG